jgi:hypothetical protein
MPNHFHLLFRTGNVSISTVMRRILTGYAVWYNRKRKRHGYLFQNRFKSILCQEDAYLLELVRYIHLNPLRAGLVQSLEELDSYSCSGHSTLMGNSKTPWQSTEEILRMFGIRSTSARRAYRIFVEKGIEHGSRPDLMRGGLIRSAGGWEEIKALSAEKNYQRSDERILGDGDFVSQVLAKADEKMQRRLALRARGIDLEKIALHVSALMDIKTEDIWKRGKHQRIVDARSVLCFWAVHELGVSMTSLGRKLGLSTPAISKSVTRGKQISESKGFRLIES